MSCESRVRGGLLSRPRSEEAQGMKHIQEQCSPTSGDRDPDGRRKDDQHLEPHLVGSHVLAVYVPKLLGKLSKTLVTLTGA